MMGSSAAFVAPAMDFIRAHGGAVTFNKRLRSSAVRRQPRRGARFRRRGRGARPGRSGDPCGAAGGGRIAGAAVARADRVPRHRQCALQARCAVSVPPITGVINGTVEWLFAFPNRLSVTISAADRLLDTPREELAAIIWAMWRGLPALRQRCRRGKSCASGGQRLRRCRSRMRSGPAPEPGGATCCWPATGSRRALPGTIEGAIRSGNRAADIVLARESHGRTYRF